MPPAEDDDLLPDDGPAFVAPAAYARSRDPVEMIVRIKGEGAERAIPLR